MLLTLVLRIEGRQGGFSLLSHSGSLSLFREGRNLGKVSNILKLMILFSIPFMEYFRTPREPIDGFISLFFICL